MALRGVKVIEFAGLAPAPFCGMILADFGASVIRIDKVGLKATTDCLTNGKQLLAINLKHESGVKIVRRLCKTADVLLAPYRKGVMESLQLGPDVLLKENPRLIYARLTGYGQHGPYSKKAGHDINYLALSGLLSLIGREGENPLFPVNLAADFGGGGLTCALGILLALFERHTSGLGQVVDCDMVSGTAYLGSWLYRSRKLGLWGNNRGKNILDSGTHFYEVYKTKDGKFLGVGALEPQFYTELLKGLELTYDEAPQFESFEENKKLFSSIFAQKTQDEWCRIFDKLDGCVAPVLSLDEAPKHPHSIEEKTFVCSSENEYVPAPAPKLSRTPGKSMSVLKPFSLGEHTELILKQLNYTTAEILDFEKEGVVDIPRTSKL